MLEVNKPFQKILLFSFYGWVDSANKKGCDLFKVTSKSISNQRTENKASDLLLRAP